LQFSWLFGVTLIAGTGKLAQQVPDMTSTSAVDGRLAWQ
jgi:hypothetical protein